MLLILLRKQSIKEQTSLPSDFKEVIHTSHTMRSSILKVPNILLDQQ